MPGSLGQIFVYHEDSEKQMRNNKHALISPGQKKQPKITAYRLIQYLSQVFLLLNLLSKLIPKNKRKEKKNELKEILTTVKRLINYNFFLSESLNANPLKTHDNEY